MFQSIFINYILAIMYKSINISQKKEVNCLRKKNETTNIFIVCVLQVDESLSKTI